MNNIEIVANTFEDFKKYEQWIFSLTPLEENVNVSIFCKENSITYFYSTKKEFNNLFFITAGEN